MDGSRKPLTHLMLDERPR